MEFNFNSFGNSKQTISYCEVDKCKAVVDLKQQLDQLKSQLEAYKMEAEEGKEINAELKAENKTLKQTLAEIKEITIAAKMEVLVNMDVFWDDILQKISEVNQCENQ